ncbi:MAG TPA: C40 family peptidase [Micromonosporaceae bacterium]
MALHVGAEAEVRVAVATLWARPEAVRPVDAAATRVPPDIPGWISAMDTDQRVGDGVRSQLLLGERVLVTAIRPDGWAHVVALEQPAPRLDPRGYPGWLPVDQLVPAEAPAAGPTEPAGDAPLVVDVLRTDLRAEPHGAVVVPDVVLGTRLVPSGAAVHGWQPVRVPGHAEPRWLPSRHLTPVPTGRPSAEQVLAVARRMVGTVYIWGGLSPYGIDCSGLVQLTWRRLGVRLPRDAADQAAGTDPVRHDEIRPGDLYFFARPGRSIHHVGIVTSDGPQRRMIDACYARRRVDDLPLTADRSATLAGIHRVA